MESQFFRAALRFIATAFWWEQSESVETESTGTTSWRHPELTIFSHRTQFAQINSCFVARVCRT